MIEFTIVKKSNKSRARMGILKTPHGDVQTPSLVPVATRGTLKGIPPKDIKDIGVQIAFVNTFHLSIHPGVAVIKKFGGIHAYGNLTIPLMSDSAGFQVFSLRPLPRISEEGVTFRSPRDGAEVLFTPEISVQNQGEIGADIFMAFDECIYYGASYEYTKEATDRTHRWLVRCIDAKKRKEGALYGIIQGGVFKDRREESAKFVVRQDVGGIAIGGVSVGETKKELYNQVRWVAPHIPEHFPVHLLGVGRIEDVYGLVPLGIDTFDCVEPTRLARNGVAYGKRGKDFCLIDVTKSRYLTDKNPIQKTCDCYTCQSFSLSFVHHLFKERELLGYYLLTYHNLFFFEQTFREIRSRIQKGLM